MKSGKRVVVVHYAVSFDPYIESITDELANNGYRSVAIDFWGGKITHDINEARNLRASVTKELLDKCLINSVTLLKSSGTRKIGTLGFLYSLSVCMRPIS